MTENVRVLPRDRRRGGVIDRIARSAVRSRLAKIERGRVVVCEAGERSTYGESTPHPDLDASIEIVDAAAWRSIALGGTVGAGEAFMRGEWRSDDLTALVRVLLRNRSVLESVEGASTKLKWLVDRCVHFARRNTKHGSRRNIARHYDLGNDFFELVLDPTMMYSSAVFEAGVTDLEEASRRKLDLICRDLELSPGMEVCEIGTGWGGFAVHAASRYGCRVLTTTISSAQYRAAVERVERAGLRDLVEVVLHDYRDLADRVDRRFDRLVSIEMVEAVGLDYLDVYFETCRDLLKPGGRMSLQAITIDDALFDEYRRSVDFIQRYVFPGGALPSMSALYRAIETRAGMRVERSRDITPSYPKTLSAWRENFRTHLPRVRALGYDAVFERMWEFYLGYCEGGFLERTVGTVQMTIARPAATEV